MSVHSSLRSKGKGKRSRSVLKRFERVQELLEKEKWKPGNSVFGLPKLKLLQIKLKKAKKAKELEAAASEQAPAAATGPEKKTAPAKKEEKQEKK